MKQSDSNDVDWDGRSQRGDYLLLLQYPAFFVAAAERLKSGSVTQTDSSQTLCIGPTSRGS